MKLLKRLLAMSCALTLLSGTLCSCNLFSKGDEETDAPDESESVLESAGSQTYHESTTEPTTDTPVIPSFELFVADVPISQYQIVYARSPLTQKIGSNTGKSVGEDIGAYILGDQKACDFDYQSAVRLQALIYQKTGVKLSIVPDVGGAVSPYEILVGNTLRSEEIPSGVENFTCKLQGNSKRFLIGGGSYGATWHAIDQLEAFFQSEEKQLDLQDAQIGKGTCELTVIACIGDSITYGTQALPMGSQASADGITAPFGKTAAEEYLKSWLSYPAVLGRENWKDCVVYNYGKGWASVLNYGSGGPYYYANTAEFAQCLAASDSDDISFDLILFMLGTNDSSQNNDWTDAKKLEYKNEVKSIVDQIRVGSENAQLALMNVPHRGNPSLNVWDESVRAVQKEAAQALLNEGYTVTHYDMEAYTMKHLSHDPSRESADRPTEWEIHKDFYNIVTETDAVDPTHPTYLGYSLMAKGVGELVNYLFGRGEKPADYIIALN